MMRPSFRHIAIWILAAVLLIGQTGLPLHQIYCFCKGEWKASFFAEAPSNCSEHEEESDGKMPSCCSKHMGCSENEGTGAGLPCTEDQVVYLQLDEPSLPKTYDSWKLLLEHTFPALVPNFDHFCILTLPIPAPTPDIPPPVWKDGRVIRIQVQSFLC